MKTGDIMKKTQKSFVLPLLANLKKNKIEELDKDFFINELLGYIGYNKEIQKTFLMQDGILLSPIQIFNELEFFSEIDEEKIIIKIKNKHIENILKQYSENELRIIEKISKEIEEKIKLNEFSSNNLTWIIKNPNEDPYMITRYVKEQEELDCFVEEQLFTDGRVIDNGTKVLEVNKIGKIKVRSLKIEKSTFVLLAQKSENRFLNLKLYSNESLETNKKVLEDWEKNRQEFFDVGKETPRVFQKKKVG